MPLSPVSFLERGGGNQLLQGLLSGSQVSLTQALSDAVQLTRDANSNQLSQEKDFLQERQFDRTFREGVRQFDITDDDRDADRALATELGRGGLDVARGGLEISRDELKIETDKEAALDSIRARERIAEDPLAFRSQYMEWNPDATQMDVEKARERELNSITRDYARHEATDSAQLAHNSKGLVGLLPPATPRDDTARETATLGIDFITDGNFVEGKAHLDKALAQATPGSGDHAYILSASKSLEAVQAAKNAGNSISMEAATEALDIYTKHKPAAFDTSPNFAMEVAAILAAETKEKYIDSGAPTKRGKVTPAELGTRRKNRAALYEAVIAASRADLNKARARTDPFASVLDGLLPE